MSKFSEDPGYLAFRILQAAFVIAPILAGLDKFFNSITDWSIYLSPLALQYIDGRDSGFMMIVGIVELIVGLGMIWKPKVFSYIIATWLFLVILSLVSAGHFLDIALRDFVLLLAVISLGMLSRKYAASSVRSRNCSENNNSRDHQSSP